MRKFCKRFSIQNEKQKGRLQNGHQDVSVEEACDFLRRLTEAYSIRMLSDDHGVQRLPKWVKSARQTTEGHLVELAKAHGAMLATFDEKIPGAFVIS